MMSQYEIQANNFASAHGVKLVIISEDFRPYFSDDKESRSVFKCRLSRGRKSYTFDFGQSLINMGVPPTLYDVLSCLTKCDPGTFGDFCADFGYNEDSRTAERIYKAVCREWRAVGRLFSDVLTELQEIA